MKLLLVPILALSATAGTSHAGPNAADEYREIVRRFRALPEQTQHMLIYSPAWMNQCDESQVVSQSLMPIVQATVRASKREICDYELDYSQGPGLLIPHISDIRNLSRIILYEAQRSIFTGDRSTAVHYLDAAIRMAVQLKQDQLLISSLVGMAIFSQTIEVIDNMESTGDLGPEEAQHLLRGLSRIDSNNPFGMVDAIRMEKVSLSKWFREQIKTSVLPDGTIEPTEEFKEAMMMLHQEADIELKKALENLDRGVDEFERYMDDVLALFVLEDEERAQKGLETLEARLLNNEYGDVSRLMGMHATGLLKRRNETQIQIKELTERLQDIANETRDPTSGNAAMLYIRIANTIDALLADSDLPPADVQNVLDELMMATLFEECEFPLEEDYPPSIVPQWSTGLHRGLALLLADADARAAAGDASGCLSRLNTAIRVSADLAESHSIVDSIIAQHAVIQALERLMVLEAEEQIDAVARRSILQALRTIPARDPFGYMSAADITRRQLAVFQQKIDMEGLMFLDDPEELQREMEAIERKKENPVGIPTDPDELLFAIAWHEIIFTPSMEDTPCWPGERNLDALGDLLDQTAIQEARQQATESRQAAEVGVSLPMTPVAGIATPTIQQQRAEGAQLLKNWKRRLEKP